MPNALPWFRCYTEILDDLKVQMMSEVDQRRLVMLLAFRGEGKPIETFRETQIAFRLRISVDELRKTKPVFIENGFIDNDWKVLNWDKRQYVSDSSSDRVRQYRERKKQSETFQFDDRPSIETISNVSETPPEADTDTEQKQNKKQKRKTLPKAKPPVDERFSIFREDFEKDFRWLNKAGAPWDAKEATRLSGWLRANPEITREQWRGILKNRRVSPVSRGAPLSGWIIKALSWLSGTADEWGKPIKANGFGGNHGEVPAGKTEGNLAVLAESINRGKRQSAAHKNGVLSASEDGFGDSGTIHGVPSAAGPESIPSGDGDDF